MESEIIGRRRVNAKHFALGNNRFRAEIHHGPIHYEDDDDNLQDINLTPVDRGGFFEITDAPYNVQCAKDRIEAVYVSRKRGDAKISLARAGSMLSPSFNVAPIIQGNRIVYEDVAPGLDIYFLFRARGMEAFKRIKTPEAAKEFEWDIDESESKEFQSKNVTIGHDNKNRKVEASNIITGVVIANGRKTFKITETITGRVSEIIDPTTRVRGWVNAAQYPLVIDAPDITEEIAVGGNDGIGGFAAAYSWFHDYWLITSAKTMKCYDFGGNDITGIPWARFTTIGLPQGAVIDNAALKVKRFGGGAGALTIKATAHDVDNAANPTVGAQAFTWPRTTANDTQTISSNGTHTFAVTSIVQEIVDRTGWTSSNAMLFLLRADPVDQAASHRASFRAYEATDTNATIVGASVPGFVLEINYGGGDSGGAAAMMGL